MFPLINNTRTKHTASRSFRFRAVSFVLCCAIILALASPIGSKPNPSQYVYARTAEDVAQEVEDLEQEVSDLETEISDLEQEVSDLGTQISDLEQDKDDLLAEQEDLASQRDETAESLEEQKAQSEIINAQITAKSEEIAINLDMIEALGLQIEEKTTAIATQEATILDLEAQHADTFEMLKVRLRGISQTNSSISFIQLLLGSDSYAEYLLSFKLTERISQNDQHLMDSLDSLKTLIADAKTKNEADKAALETEKADLEAVQAENETAKEELEGLYAESEALADEMAADVDYLNEQIALIDEQQSTLDAAIAQALADQEARRQEQADREQDKEDLESEMEDLEAEQDRLEQEEQESDDDSSSDSSDSGSSGSGNVSSSISGTMYWPAPTCLVITSSYKYRPQFGRWHYGTDIAAWGSAEGEPIVAAADGTVIYASWMSGYGYCVMIDHGYDSNGNQIVTLYAHSSALFCSVGDYVYGGQTHIANVGNTGNSYGAHLHFEVRVNGSAVNAVSNGYLSTAGITVLG